MHKNKPVCPKIQRFDGSPGTTFDRAEGNIMSIPVSVLQKKKIKEVLFFHRQAEFHLVCVCVFVCSEQMGNRGFVWRLHY